MLRRRTKGFTLLEILIGAVLIAVGVGTLGISVASVRRFFKETEDRSQAMRLAISKIGECLAKGYSGLADTSDPNYHNSSLSLEVSTKTASGPKANIPYKKIEAVASYTADRGKGGVNSIRKVCLTNIIPYPKVHTHSIKVSCVNSEVCSEAPADAPGKKTGDSDDSDEANYKVVKGNKVEGNKVEGNKEEDLGFNFNYATKKNIKVAYTISFRTSDENKDLSSVDQIRSTFFLDNEIFKVNDKWHPVAVIPLMSQPTFSDIVVMKGVSAGEHTIDVRWVKRTENGSNTAGKIWMIDSSLSIIAAEVD